MNALSEATGLTIEVERPASDYDTILMQKLSAGESYDLIYVGASQYANLVEQGALTDITEKVQASRILPKTCLPANGRTSPWTARSTRASTSASCMRNKMGAASQNIAVDVDWAAWVGLHNANAAAGGVSTENYEIVSLPGCLTPDGTYMLRKGNASLFAVPANAKNVDGAVKVLEYFATQEGGELLSLGVKDHDYTVDAEGNYALTEIGKSHSMDHGAPVPMDKNFVNPIGMNLGVEEALTYLDYASVERIIPNESDYKSIVGKWAVSIIKGEVDTLAGLERMRNELVLMGICEK